ncbi:hypothetical protein IFR05_003095 [Cadophora sp. M221]|nr:hypothetical protein IFR05_003095 [Cadophora sp. M221]
MRRYNSCIPGSWDTSKRTDPESMLRFLNIDYTVEVRELEKMVNHQLVGTRQAYAALVMEEEVLKTSWKKDDEERGMGCELNKIPVFNFLGETTSTAGSN